MTLIFPDKAIKKKQIAHISSYGVDDYLHQAADSGNWPKDTIYMTDGDGIPMPKSLGVHEHWNNSLCYFVMNFVILCVKKKFNH